jgi:hypothetical protein
MVNKTQLPNSTIMNNLFTFNGVVKVCIDGGAADNVSKFEDHGGDFLLRDPARIFRIYRVNHVECQLQTRRKGSENSLISLTSQSLNLKQRKIVIIFGFDAEKIKECSVEKKPKKNIW